MADTQGTRWRQIKSADRLGAGTQGQSVDQTLTAATLAGYASDGVTLTDSGVVAPPSGTVLVGSTGTAGVFPVGSWYGQVPRGVRNGSNTVFQLDYDLGSPFTILMGNGVGQLPDVDGPHLTPWYLPGAQYSITGNVLTMISAPAASEWLYIWYFISNPHPLSVTYAALHTITIDHAQVAADLTDFVFTFTGTYSFLKTAGSGGTMQNPSAYDIVFSLDTAGTTLLDYQRVTHNFTNGKVEYKIRIPALSFSSDTVIYVLSGSTAVTTDQSNTTGTWGSDYLEVFHFGDGTTLDLVGSIAGTVATNHGATATAGDFGGGASFNGNGDAGDPSGAAWIDLGSPFNSLTLTLEVFGVATNSHSGNTMASNISGGSGYQIGQPAASPWQAKLNGSSYTFPVPGGLYNPYYQALTIDGSTIHLFSGDQGGNTLQSSSSAGSPSVSVSNLFLGRTPGSGTNLFLGGFIEEVRISSVVRTYERWETTRKNVFHRDSNLVGQPVFYTVT